MRTFQIHWAWIAICLVSLPAYAQPEKAAEAVKQIGEGGPASLSVQDYADGPESAAAFLRQLGSLQSEKSRVKVVQFSVALVRTAKKESDTQTAWNVDAVVSQLVSLLDEDPSGRVRAEAAKGLREIASPELADRHHVSILRAYEKHRDIDTLLLYTSLPSYSNENVLLMARSLNPEGGRDTYKLNSILAKCGDRNATDSLISEAANVVEISNANLYELINALAFASNDRVNEFLARGLRSEEYVSLPGGGKIPKRNCFAYALVQMNVHNEEFPVKDADYIFGEDDLNRIEQWCIDEFGVDIPREPRQELNVIPSYQ